jgi:hypothetical protein
LGEARCLHCIAALGCVYLVAYVLDLEYVRDCSATICTDMAAVLLRLC